MCVQLSQEIPGETSSKIKEMKNTGKNIAIETYSRGQMIHADVSIMAI